MEIFLNDAGNDYELQDEELNLEEALTEFYELSDEEGSFFGIKTEKKTIQFAYVDEDKWLIDIPYDMKNFICLQKYSTYEECTKIINSIFNGKQPEEIKGLIKINIMSESLDDNINK